MPKPPPEWMERLNALLAEDPTSWTAEEQAAYLQESGSLIEAVLQLQLKVEALGDQEMSEVPDTVEKTKE
jgi:hypothetical protein